MEAVNVLRQYALSDTAEIDYSPCTEYNRTICVVSGFAVSTIMPLREAARTCQRTISMHVSFPRSVGFCLG